MTSQNGESQTLLDSSQIPTALSESVITKSDPDHRTCILPYYLCWSHFRLPDTTPPLQKEDAMSRLSCWYVLYAIDASFASNHIGWTISNQPVREIACRTKFLVSGSCDNYLKPHSSRSLLTLKACVNKSRNKLFLLSLPMLPIYTKLMSPSLCFNKSSTRSTKVVRGRCSK